MCACYEVTEENRDSSRICVRSSWSSSLSDAVEAGAPDAFAADDDDDTEEEEETESAGETENGSFTVAYSAPSQRPPRACSRHAKVDESI